MVGSERIEDFKERKPVKIGIPRIDPSDAVLSHQNRGMRVVQEVPCQVRGIAKHLFNDGRMAFAFHQDAQPGSGKDRLDKRPCLCSRPRSSQDSWMG